MKKNIEKQTITFSRGRDRFDWDTDTLDEYIEENVDDIETRLIEQARTARFMRVQEGIKYTDKMNDIETEFDWQDGSNCGNEPQGKVNFGEQEISVGDIEILLKFCNKDLIPFWPRKKLVAGAEAEMQQLPLEQIIFDNILQKNALKVDTAIWKSDKGSINPNLNRFNGMLKLIVDGIANGEPIIQLTISSPITPTTQITSSNAVAVFQSFDRQLPQELTEKENFAYMTDRATFMELAQNIFDLTKDSPNYKIEDLIEGQKQLIGLVVPGSFNKVYWTPGLKDTGVVIGALWGNSGQMVIGTDRQGDFEEIDSWYERKERSLYFRLTFRLGTGYRFAENVAIYRPTAS